jgi:hypothetical protein
MCLDAHCEFTCSRELGARYFDVIDLIYDLLVGPPGEE